MKRLDIEVHGKDSQLFSHFIDEDGTTWVVNDKPKVGRVCVLGKDVTPAQLSAIAALVVASTAVNSTLRVRYDERLSGLKNPAMKRLMFGRTV